MANPLEQLISQLEDEIQDPEEGRLSRVSFYTTHSKLSLYHYTIFFSLLTFCQLPILETFLLYANDIPSQGLGFIDSHASVLELQLGGRDITIHQSPGVLASSRKGGTTGAGQFLSPSPFSTTVLCQDAGTLMLCVTMCS